MSRSLSVKSLIALHPHRRRWLFLTISGIYVALALLSHGHAPFLWIPAIAAFLHFLWPTIMGWILLWVMMALYASYGVVLMFKMFLSETTRIWLGDVYGLLLGLGTVILLVSATVLVILTVPGPPTDSPRTKVET